MVVPFSFISECVSVDFQTGKVTWAKRPKHHFSSESEAARYANRHEGTAVAEQVCVHGYKTLRVKYGGRQRRIKLHRLVLGMHLGRWPEIVDHINGDRLDNRLCNLREVDRVANVQNTRKARSNNKSGLLGVSTRKTGNKRFVSCIRYAGKQHIIGTFYTPEEAHAAYIAEKRKRHAGAVI